MGGVGSAFHRVAETYHAHPHTGTAGMSVYLRSAAFGSKEHSVFKRRVQRILYGGGLRVALSELSSCRKQR